MQMVRENVCTNPNLKGFRCDDKLYSLKFKTLLQGLIVPWLQWDLWLLSTFETQATYLDA